MKSQSGFKRYIRNTGNHSNSRKGKKLFKRKKQTSILFLTGNDKIISRETEKTQLFSKYECLFVNTAAVYCAKKARI